jgi:hypothetical protein
MSPSPNGSVKQIAENPVTSPKDDSESFTERSSPEGKGRERKGKDTPSAVRAAPTAADTPSGLPTVTAADVVAAWVDALAANGTHSSSAQRGQVGRLARELLVGNDPARVIDAARAAGAKGFATIDRELTAMAGRRATGEQWPGGLRPLNRDPRTGMAVER